MTEIIKLKWLEKYLNRGERIKKKVKTYKKGKHTDNKIKGSGRQKDSNDDSLQMNKNKRFKI